MSTSAFPPANIGSRPAAAKMCSGLPARTSRPPTAVLGTNDLSVGVGVLGGGVDHVLLEDPPGVLGEHAHEIAPAAGDHEHPKLVRPQIVEQLEHRLVHQLDIRHPQLRLLDGSKPIAHLRVELLRVVPFHVRANAASSVPTTSGS